ncbi:hypothetical protein niasHS_008536 [Heterodera schachtii]|uniref:Uncharacterized protein n=1 Tax=Heterodera schachtii TaxID=97005 RepID=A0ABD2IYH0_HETSC
MFKSEIRTPLNAVPLNTMTETQAELGFTAAMNQMANVLDASRPRVELEQRSLDDREEFDAVCVEAGETGKEPENHD